MTEARPEPASASAETACTFCGIVAGEVPARVFHDEEDFMVFQNRLTWVPIMLLVIPKVHMTQQELWRDQYRMARIGELAVRVGETFCPDGYRILSNFGRLALQSQPHAHVHVVGGAELGPYVVPRQWLVGG